MRTVFAWIGSASIGLWFAAGLTPHPLKIPMGYIALCGVALAWIIGLIGALLTQHE